MAGPKEYRDDETAFGDEYESDPGTYLSNIANYGASGASAGSAAGPWGALIGGVVGAGVGAFQGKQTDDELRAAFEQQQQLESDLAGAGSDFELYLQDQALAQGIARQEGEIGARQASARAGLTPAASESLAMQSQQGVDQAYMAQRGPALMAAKQAELGERQQILSEYELAQSLADRAVSDTDRLAQVFGGVGEGMGALGEMGAFDKFKGATSTASDVSTDDETLALLADTERAAPSLADAMSDEEINSLYAGDRADTAVETPEAASVWDGIEAQASQAFEGEGSMAGALEAGRAASTERPPGGPQAAPTPVSPASVPGQARAKQEASQGPYRRPPAGGIAPTQTPPVEAPTDLYTRSWDQVTPVERLALERRQEAEGRTQRVRLPDGTERLIPNQGFVLFDPSNPQDSRVISVADLTPEQRAAFKAPEVTPEAEPGVEPAAPATPAAPSQPAIVNVPERAAVRQYKIAEKSGTLDSLTSEQRRDAHIVEAKDRGYLPLEELVSQPLNEEDFSFDISLETYVQGAMLLDELAILLGKAGKSTEAGRAQQQQKPNPWTGR